jgi:hypothetical protein
LRRCDVSMARLVGLDWSRAGRLGDVEAPFSLGAGRGRGTPCPENPYTGLVLGLVDVEAPDRLRRQEFLGASAEGGKAEGVTHVDFSVEYRVSSYLERPIC